MYVYQYIYIDTPLPQSHAVSSPGPADGLRPHGGSGGLQQLGRPPPNRAHGRPKAPQRRRWTIVVRAAFPLPRPRARPQA